MNLLTSPYLVLLPETSERCAFLSLLNKKTYTYDKKVLSILKQCIHPTSLLDLYEQYDQAEIENLINDNILLNYLTVWDQYHFIRAEIETHTLCNFRCKYCPISISPSTKQEVMSLDNFEECLKKISSQKTISEVTFNAYNEPTIDPYFCHRTELVTQYELNLAISTNGSALTVDKLKQIKKNGVGHLIRFNLPSVDLKKYEALTQTTGILDSVLNSIDMAVSMDINICIIVNGVANEALQEMEAILKRFPKLSKEQVQYGLTTDRAGRLEEEYYQDIHNTNPHLFGCSIAFSTLYIGVDGMVYLCSCDYGKKYVYGNIFNDTIDEIAKSVYAANLKKNVFGAQEAPADFICRRCIDMKRLKPFKQRLNKFM